MHKKKKERLKIILTGGGSAGHVIPNIALLSKLQQENWEVFYLGSKNGIERKLIAQHHIPYVIISTGKLRRYFSWQNFIDPFKALYGMLQACYYCCRIKPNIVFSKGGFVSLPVVIGAWLNRIPVVIHESDLIPGLANKLSFPFAKHICVTFANTKQNLRHPKKSILTGSPIRDELYKGNAEKGLALCGFTKNKKTILAYGGGLGSEIINRNLRALLPDILQDFQIIHACGQNKVDPKISYPGYKQFAFIGPELPDLMACADLVISRAGANSLVELLTLAKPHILIPLAKNASRGEQVLNADYHAKLGLSIVLNETELSPETLLKKINYVIAHKDAITKKLREYKKTNSIEIIYDILQKDKRRFA